MKKSRYGFVVWLTVTLFVLYSFCLNTAAAVFAEAIKTSLSASDVEVSIAAGSFIVGFALMQIPAGYLLDNYNARFVVSVGVLLLALGNILTSVSTNIELFTAANFMQGVGASFSFIAAGIVISQWFPQRWFPILFGLTQTSACIASAVIHYFFTLELMTHTWNQIYLVLAIIGTVLFFVTLSLVKSPARYKRPEQISLGKSIKTVCSNKQILLCAAAATLSFGTLLSYAGFWYLNVQKFYTIDTLDSVTISGMMFLGIGLGTPAMGWLSNRLRSRKLVIHVSLCLGTMGLLMCLYLPHYQINNLYIIEAVSLITGFLLAGSMLFYTVVSEISSNETRGVALSVTNTGVFLFYTVLMFIPYLLITSVSTTFFTYLWVLPFFLILSIMLNYFINESYQR